MRDLEITLIGPNPDETQGGGVRTHTLLNAVDRLGVRINRVYYSFHKDRFSIRRTNEGQTPSLVEIDFPNHWPPLLKISSLFFITAYTWKLARPSRLILCTFGSMLFAIPPIVVSRLRDKPIVLDYIDTELYGVPETVCRFFLQKAERVFAISHYLVDQAVRYKAKKVIYVPTFVDSDFFSLDPDGRKKYRAQLQIQSDEIAIGYAGSLAPFEGLPVLLEACRRLLSTHANTRLVIVGKKMLPTDCDIPALATELGIAEHVYLQAPVPRQEYPKLLSAFDILCVPRTDCLMSRAANPIKVTEYLSMGIPVVCSSVGEITHIIRNGINGYLAKPGDSDELEKVLEDVMTHRDQAQDVGRKGRQEVIDKYSVELIGERIRSSIMEIIDRG